MGLKAEFFGGRMDGTVTHVDTHIGEYAYVVHKNAKGRILKSVYICELNTSDQEDEATLKLNLETVLDVTDEIECDCDDHEFDE